MNRVQRRRYPTDLTNSQWRKLCKFIPVARPGPNEQKHERREIVNALRYKAVTGCSWRNLPTNFPPWHTVADYFYRWRDAGVWEKIVDALRTEIRVVNGREPEPSVGIIDSQSVKSSNGGEAIGYDGNKKIHGRKRHILVDALGLLLAVIVTAAHVQDRDAFRELAHAGRAKSQRLEKIFVDGAYNGDVVRLAEEETRIVAEVSKRSDVVKTFEPLRIRWHVEQSFGWWTHSRQLSREYDRSVASSEAWIQIVFTNLMLNRIA